QLGPEGYSEIGKMGGEARKEQLGPEGYSELGTMGGQRVSELVETGKQSDGGSSSSDRNR
ncbi:KGG domain-containing protein, partial [Acinetobacter baumannii]